MGETLPSLRVRATGQSVPLQAAVTTVGRGRGVDVRLDHPSVSVLHAELVRRGPYVYVADLGLSVNGTLVNGRPVTRRLLADQDVIRFGQVSCTAAGIAAEPIPEAERADGVPDLTRRELEVLTELCRPGLSAEAFTVPATAGQIAAALVVTEAAVKQHLLRLCHKFGVPEGPDRRVRLANKAVAAGLARPGALPAGTAARQPQEPPPAEEGGGADAPGAWMASAWRQGADQHTIAAEAGADARTVP